jgi:tetratricopeptide (TPR) repeat protein
VAPPKTEAPAKPEIPPAKRSDPKLADVLEALTGTDEAKFEALLNPAPRPGEKPLGQPIETSPATETGTVSVPPPLGPDIETSATAASPAAPESETAGGRAELGVTFVPSVRGELNERLALEDRAHELFESGRFADAETEAKRLLALLTKDAPPTTNPAIATVNLLGAIYESQARLAEAEEQYRHALWLRISRDRKSRPDLTVSLDQNEALSLSRLASVASARGNAEDADRLFERALRISTRYEHPATVNLITEYARHEWSNGRLEKAEDLFRRSIALAGRLSDFIPASDTVYALNSLARVKHAQGDVDASLAAFREAKNVPLVSALTAPGGRDD